MVDALSKEPKIKISGVGWLCVLRGREWIAVFKLTPAQLREWREVIT